ncbi:ribosome recycling factor [Alkaliphilus oremlandii]|uniref:Ribosome-recycling factor n=1 Tax=Alkaliphilus oremlandii (strain OhILAs) TaxID=350688 RepID=RRF_ALKOO|nr:RecName: Full=Ribosome-recycling factor; Short=RRF; AltName: Full=Ribosome-releasing factor [Alkaliphilus oremlandii OhILAs]ABW19059.1 ribosome recycling factor [Alkaliphilus oremlandii OhILAs]
MKMEIHKNLEEKMNKTINALKDELASIRAGRANPAMLDRIVVEYYGSPTPIKQIAAITAPEPRIISIQPYDGSALSSIEKAILQSDLGVNPSNDGKLIRIIVPQLTEERRKELTKVAKKTSEDAKVVLRNERRNANDRLKKMQKDNEITEDELKTAQDEVQKITDKFIKMVDELTEKKEKDIMEV